MTQRITNLAPMTTKGQTVRNGMQVRNDGNSQVHITGNSNSVLSLKRSRDCAIRTARYHTSPDGCLRFPTRPDTSNLKGVSVCANYNRRLRLTMETNGNKQKVNGATFRRIMQCEPKTVSLTANICKFKLNAICGHTRERRKKTRTETTTVVGRRRMIGELLVVLRLCVGNQAYCQRSLASLS